MVLNSDYDIYQVKDCKTENLAGFNKDYRILLHTKKPAFYKRMVIEYSYI